MGDQNMEHVGARLRRWRLRRGLSQRVLADLAGFSQGYVAQIESGTAPLERRAAREALARALQISVGELTGSPGDGAFGSPVGATAIAELRAGIVALTVPMVGAGDQPPTGGVDTVLLDHYYTACRYDLLVPALARALTTLGTQTWTANRTTAPPRTANRPTAQPQTANETAAQQWTADETADQPDLVNRTAAQGGTSAGEPNQTRTNDAEPEAAVIDGEQTAWPQPGEVGASGAHDEVSRENTAWAGREAISEEEAKRARLRSVVEVCSTTVATCVQLGYQDLTLAPGEVAVRAAEELGEAAYLGLANYTRIRAVGGVAGAERVVDAGIERLGPHVGVDPVAAGIYGMHHLIRAEMAARAGQGGVAAAHLGEANGVAAYVGERPDDWFSFGPTNVGMWRLAILVALGDGPAARTSPAGFSPDVLASAQRRATYFIDLARALLQGRGRDDAAAAALYRAEMIAPQQVCASSGAREALRTLLSRPRYGRDSRLRGLAGRAGIQ